MKVEGLLFAILTVFFAVVATVYWFWSGEIVGGVALALTAALSFLIAFYMLYTGKRVGYRPADRSDGLIEEADPDYGFFSPTSWWPLPVAVSCSVIVLGFVFAVWLLLVGVALLLISLVGFVFEYYRGAWAE